MKKIRVGVLMGGKSQEREVSFNSGRTVCDHLDSQRYKIIPIFQKKNGDLFILPYQFLHRGKIADFEHRLKKEAKQIIWDNLKKIVDFVFIAMHGKFAEDGTLQGFLEILGIPYLGSKVFGSALGMDKIVQKEFLKINGIDVAKGIYLYPEEIKNFDNNKKKLKIEPPYIVKPYKEGSSLGVQAVFEKNNLQQALQKTCSVDPEKKQAVLIEEKINGMEISCCVITDYKTGKLIALEPTEVVHETGKHIHDYKQKYMPGCGHEYTPARCSNESINLIKKTCIKVMKILEISNIGRIDGFLTNNGKFVVVDPNTLTGMGPASFFFREAAEKNINHTQLINHVIETELHNYGLLEKILIQEKKQAKTMNFKKIKIAVLMGGKSNEKEISLESGRNIIYKLSPKKYCAMPIFVSDQISNQMELYKISNKQLVRNSTKEIKETLDSKDKINWDDLGKIADFVFIALHGGQGENGCVQGALEMLGLPYNGSSVLCSSLCANKFKCNNFLKNKGFDIPQSILISSEKFILNQDKIIKEIASQFKFPIILKPHNDGCSTMVLEIKNPKNLQSLLNKFFKKFNTAMIEEKINGIEITVGAIGNNKVFALPPSQSVAKKAILSVEEKFLPGAGENQTPAPLPKPTLRFIQEKIIQAYKTLNCKGYARVDCFFQPKEQSPTKKNRLIILEVNTLPGMTPATCIFHQAAEVGIKPMDFIDLIVQLGLNEHCKCKEKNINFEKVFLQTKENLAN